MTLNAYCMSYTIEWWSGDIWYTNGERSTAQSAHVLQKYYSGHNLIQHYKLEKEANIGNILSSEAENQESVILISSCIFVYVHSSIHWIIVTIFNFFVPLS